ncbi:MAG: hypothetical protein ACTSYI_12095 [Promethearchaeota archaeon]
MAGSNQSQIMEKMNKNSKYIKNQRIAMKVIMSIYLAIMILVPIQSLLLVSESIGDVALDLLLLASSGMVAAFFLMQMFYLLMFGLFTSTGFFTPESYKWLTTLPIENHSISKIGLFTLFRSLNAQTIVMILLFPIATFIMSLNIFITLIALVVSIINTGMSLAILIIFGAKFTKVINSNVGNNRVSTLIRMGVIIGYLIGTLLATMGVQFVTPLMESMLASTDLSSAAIITLNQWLSLIPFTLSGGYLTSMLFLGITNFSTIQIASAILGVIIQLFVVYLLGKKAIGTFTQAIRPDDSKNDEKTITSTVEDVQISTLGQRGAFFKKDAQNITRDVQSLMFVLLPIILPTLVFLLTEIPALTGEEALGDTTGIYFLTFTYLFIGAFMLMLGIIDIDKTGASISASLPIVIREQAKAKIQWAVIILPVANLLPTLFYLGKPYFLEILVTFLIVIPMGIIFAAFVLELKVLLFGKMKYKYVLDEVKIEHKVLKIILMVIIGLVITVGFLILTETMMIDYSMEMAYLVLGCTELVLGIGVYYIFSKMFPKTDYKLK